MKYKPGPLAGELSGSIGTMVASHNRYGVYFRERVIPVNPDTLAQQRSRGQLATASSSWASLGSGDLLAWKNFASLNPIIDRLGAKQVLSANAAYVMLACRRLLYDNTLPTAAPTAASPPSLTLLTATWDIGAGAFALTFTPTPIGATRALYITGAVINSPTVNFVKPRFKFLTFSAANQATGLDCQVPVQAVFGSLSAGQTVFLRVAVFDTDTNLLSLPLQVSGVVVST